MRLEAWSEGRSPKARVSLLAMVGFLGLALLFGGCPKASPEDQIAKARTQYTVKLNSWQPQPVEVEAPEPAMAEAAEGEAAAVAMAAESAMVAEESEEGAEEGEMEITMDDLAPPKTNVLFDLLVRFEGSNPLPGITLDITHADGSETTKEVRRQWVDTTDFRNKETKQVDFVLEGFDFVEGDLFSVELRSFVPAEERDAYQEFATSG